jgi:hypothetical protein
VDKAHALAVEVRTISRQIYEGHQKTLQSPRQLTDDYLEIALWRGFDFALNENPQNWYGPGDNSKGVKYGTWVIETSASPEEVELVEKEHWNLICQLGRLPKMGLLAKEWSGFKKAAREFRPLPRKHWRSMTFSIRAGFVAAYGTKHLASDAIEAERGSVVPVGYLGRISLCWYPRRTASDTRAFVNEFAKTHVSGKGSPGSKRKYTKRSDICKR